MENKVCVVTGGANGIGRAIALKFAASGAKAVVIADIDEARAKETVSLIESRGGTASVKVTDVEIPEQIFDIMAFAADRYGSLDTLVNHVGTGEGKFTTDTSVDKLPVEVFEKVYRINVRSVFLGIQAAVPYLRASTNGPSILNCASTGSFVGTAGFATYGSTKAAIAQFTRAAAVDLAPQIRVNAYAPGAIDTGPVNPRTAEEKRVLLRGHLIPRMGSTEDVANLVNFLASDEASFITGGTYLIDGGLLAWRGSNE
jgi:NAD(P)-dependent dehydrogenase (short-subunit alcohol dehydrogenase family)